MRKNSDVIQSPTRLSEKKVAFYIHLGECKTRHSRSFHTE